MQQQQVHIKAEFNNEFRRFLLDTLTYQYLEGTLRTLYDTTERLQLEFLDDEQDWVLFSSDQELLYALELAGKPLRLKVKTESETKTIRGKGKGRGKCGDAEGPEKLKAKCGRLASRIQVIEERLKDGNLNSERERVLFWRLGQLRDKLAASTLTSESATRVPGRGRGRRRGRGCSRGRGRGRGRGFEAPEIQTDESQADEIQTEIQTDGLTPTSVSFSKTAEYRQDLKAARASGDKATIEKCLSVLEVARSAKKEQKSVLAACKQHKRVCVQELREERQKEEKDESKIKDKEEAVTKAIEAVKNARTELLSL